MKRFLLPTLLIPFAAFAAEGEYTITIKEQQFKPAGITIPTGAKVKLTIDNQDEVPVEFESAEISREAIVPPHKKATIFIGPLEQGSYRFLNDFNHHMEGTILVKPVAAKEN